MKGRLPAEIADGRRGVRNAEKFVDARWGDGALDRAVERKSDGILLGVSGGWRG
jgi:hypothetical protein